MGKRQAKPRKDAKLETHQLPVAIRAEDINHEERRISVSISSETDKIRNFWTGAPQILLHEKQAVDLSQLRDVGAVLMNHDPDQIVGKPVNVRLDERDARVRAEIVFDDDEASKRAFAKVESGSLRGASVGFRVEKWQHLEDGQTWQSPGGRSFSGPADVATKWRPMEFSLTPIPADSAVGVGRAQLPEEFRMDPKLKEALIKRGLNPEANDEEAQAFMLRIANDPQEPPKPEDPPPDGSPPTEASVRLASERAREERERCTQIMELAGLYPQHRSICETMVRDGHSVAQARGEVLQAISKERPAARSVSSGFEFGEDARKKFHNAMRDAFLLRAGRLQPDKNESAAAFATREAAARDVCPMNHMEALRHSLRTDGLSDRGTTDDLIKRAMSHSTSDFPAILKDAAEKSLQSAFREAPATWRQISRIGNARNFLPMNRPKFGTMGNLVVTPDGVPMSEGSAPDVNESFSIATYTKRFGIGRQTLINDDLDAFGRTPMQLGQAASRTVSDTVYTLLTSAAGVGPKVAEGGGTIDLFSTSHASGANYATGTGAPDVAGLSVLRTLMRKQKAFVASGETPPLIDVAPRFLLVPVALETTAEQTLNSTFDPAKSNSITFSPFKNLSLIPEARLDAGTNGTTAFYLIADPSQIEGLEVAFLNGNDAPNMIEVEGTNVLGREWGVFLDFGAKFIEHRGWTRHKGVA